MGYPPKNNWHWHFIVVVLLIGLATVLRFYNLERSPGYEWDEPVYANIASRVDFHGYPTSIAEGDSTNVPYVFHPPFDFYLKSFWFDLMGSNDVGTARHLAALCSMGVVFLVYLLVRKILSPVSAIFVLVFISTDGWLIYTNRLNFIENTLMLLIVSSVFAYAWAQKSRSFARYTLAGVLLGLAIVYKHTATYLVLLPLITSLFLRKDFKQHLLLYSVMFNILIAYVALMSLLYGDYYTNQSWVQILRSMGDIQSRGLNYGIGDALQVITATYWIFFSTMLALAAGGFLVALRTLQCVLTKPAVEDGVILGWVLSAFIFLAGIALKAPHYLVIALVPLYIFLGHELYKIFAFSKRYWWVSILVVAIVLGLNALTWFERFYVRQDNALFQTYQYMETLPKTAKVFTEECVGAGIEQPYYNLNSHKTITDIVKVRPDYLVLYSSRLQNPITSDAVADLVQHATLQQEFLGFKEKIQILQVDSAYYDLLQEQVDALPY